MRRVIALFGAMTVGWGVLATPSGADTPLVAIEGRGSAHGMGLAMDGVLGQIQAGWSYDRVLSGFYPGSVPGHADGEVQVGLSHAGAHVLELPGGGVVRSGEQVVDVDPGGRVEVRPGGEFLLNGAVPTSEPVQTPEATPPAETPSGVVPVEAALGTPTPSPTASPTPTPTPTSPPAADPTVWVEPAGEPALTLLQATGRRYRGKMRLHTKDGGVWAINHVDLETYVMGIAEEKGAGWSVEALKVLAVASRSLAASTMTWYGKNHANGFNICATSACQVYLGFDGEEEAMRQATAATAGEIRTFDGRPILAMYHGNGGGQTDSYRLIYGTGVSDPFPYLRSVRYEHANPSTWRLVTTFEEIEGALRAAERSVPDELSGIEILERGDSPRVRRLELRGRGDAVEMSGIAFADALGLRSTWFSVELVTGETPTPISRATVRAQPIKALVTPAPVARASTPAPSSPVGWLIAAALVGALGGSAIANAVSRRASGRGS